MCSYKICRNIYLFYLCSCCIFTISTGIDHSKMRIENCYDYRKPLLVRKSVKNRMIKPTIGTWK